jgi:hypothetical protein
MAFGVGPIVAKTERPVRDPNLNRRKFWFDSQRQRKPAGTKLLLTTPSNLGRKLPQIDLFEPDVGAPGLETTWRLPDAKAAPARKFNFRIEGWPCARCILILPET